jgi:hypothetical protein
MLGRSVVLSGIKELCDNDQWQPYLVHDSLFPPTMLSGAHLDDLTHVVKKKEYAIETSQM